MASLLAVVAFNLDVNQRVLELIYRGRTPFSWQGFLLYGFDHVVLLGATAGIIGFCLTHFVAHRRPIGLLVSLLLVLSCWLAIRQAPLPPQVHPLAAVQLLVVGSTAATALTWIGTMTNVARSLSSTLARTPATGRQAGDTELLSSGWSTPSGRRN